MPPHAPARTATARPRGLWLARELPFPLDNGDRTYSARLAQALAAQGVDLTFVGLATPERHAGPDGRGIRWVGVPGTRIGRARALASTMPLVSAIHATPAYRRLVRTLSREAWDFVVVDQFGMGWVLPSFPRRASGPVLVHVSKDHGASISRAIYRGIRGSWGMRMALWQNYLKTRRFEQRLLERADLVTAITAEDARRFVADAPRLRPLVLTPGYDGTVVASRRITADTPRHVVIVGSFHWVAKQHNLRGFAALADAPFRAHGIELHLIGSMPDELAADLRRNCRCVRLHGFVEDLAPHLAAARLAVVPEDLGGGFKLKFLEYLFHRVPIATLDRATAGLPAALRAALLVSDRLEGLVETIVAHIDRIDLQNALQERAFEVARDGFRWSERGADLLAAIEGRMRSRRGDATLRPSVA